MERHLHVEAVRLLHGVRAAAGVPAGAPRLEGLLARLLHRLDLSLGGGEHGVPGLGGGGLLPSPEASQGGQGDAVLAGDGAANTLEVLHDLCQGGGSGPPLPGPLTMGADCHL